MLLGATSSPPIIVQLLSRLSPLFHSTDVFQSSADWTASIDQLRTTKADDWHLLVLRLVLTTVNCVPDAQWRQALAAALTGKLHLYSGRNKVAAQLK